MPHIAPKTNLRLLLSFALIAAGAAAVLYLAYGNYLLKETKSLMENEISRSAADIKKLTGDINNLKTDIKNLNEILAATKDELATTTALRDQLGMMYNDVAEKYHFEKTRMDEFNSQITDITGTVNTLEKIKQTDPELLKKYSKIYFLNENYAPPALVKIDTEYTINAKNEYLIHAKIAPFLNSLAQAAKNDGINLKIVSAYRSFGEQTSLKSSYRMVYGSGANAFSADQGYSEHQLGTTVDFTTPEIGAGFNGFQDAPAYRWLLENAHNYGFVLSYPEDNKYYQYEPWHWRFVGRELARTLHNDQRGFYDLDQREIDQFRASFFD